MPDSITKEEMAKLLQAQAQTFAAAVKGNSVPVSNLSNFSDNLGKAGESLAPLTRGWELLGSVSGKLVDGFKHIYDATNQNIGMLQSLSKSGMNFSSDVVGMTASVKGMRVSNEEFSEIMTKNAAGFTALGGNVTRGAEAFTQLAKDFQSSEFIDGLITAGYNNKELNDVLALQLTLGKAGIRDDDASRKKSIESAAELAKEMDLTAKLTGKSREQQMEQMTKLKDDMALEAKLRQDTQGMSETQAAEYRKKVMAQIAQAELEGRGQLLKEQFTYGQAVSEQAQTLQLSMGNKAYQMTVEQGNALRAKQLEQADERGKMARSEAVAYGDSAAGLAMALIPVQNEITESTHKVMKANQAYRDGLKSIEQEEAFRGKSKEVIEAEAERRAKESQEGRNKEGVQVNQTTEAMVKLSQRSKDVESAFYNNLIVPLNKDVSKAVGDLSAKFLAPTLRRAGKDDISFEAAVGQGMTRSYEYQKERATDTETGRDAARRRNKDEAAVRMDITEPFQNTFGSAVSSGIGTAIETSALLMSKAGSMINSGAQEIQKISTPGKRSLGSLGSTGKLFEDFGQGTLMELHGKETVMTEKQLTDLMSGVKSDNIGNMITQLTKSVSNSDLSKNLNMNSNIPSKSSSDGVVSNINSNIPSKSSSDGVVSDIMNRMQYTVSSKANAENAINFSSIPDSKSSKGLTAEDMTRSLELMKSDFQNIENKSEKKLDNASFQQKTSPIIEEFGKENKLTLNDVVDRLERLNTTLTTLIDVQVDIGSKQIRATKSSGSGNVYERT
jgi:hypothetical protein